MKTFRFDGFAGGLLNVAASRQSAANLCENFSDGGFLPKAATGYTPPVIFSRETRANPVFMIEAKFSAADAAELRLGQPVDVAWR